jgi:hypothetical protein
MEILLMDALSVTVTYPNGNTVFAYTEGGKAVTFVRDKHLLANIQAQLHDAQCFVELAMQSELVIP